MDLDKAAKALKELGHVTRLSIFKILVKAGHEGLPVGALAQKLEMPNSTLTHHISGLISAGLVEQKRDGRTLYCIPQYELLQNVILFLQEECCNDSDNSDQTLF